MNTRKNTGFTIIELMIAVAIIGVLAAIAIPAYQNYIYRAKASEAISFAQAAQTAVADYYQTNGSVPTTNQAAGLNATGTNITGTNVAGVTVGTGGAITVTASISGISQFGITLSPTATSSGINWACSVSTPATNNAYVPANCRS
ncbi:pilin [Aquella oligotrophica]|uniref:Prepilin-type cleavage/methylation domain-containing protein n=1 Tax=Aquella oligotrophica TaxID=2067065 RepID=A0A2I7N6S0_9NEIS|nr:pilin [Aquella oligotrophica]AUR52163.1 prepilin-type cleavage/methylation domain-containing protein [Aquella oligotrophica]